MPRNYLNYSQYLDSQKCCNATNYISGLQGLPGPSQTSGLTGNTGPTGSSNIGFTGKSAKGETGDAGATGNTGAVGDANKSFIINHPTDIDKYLVHVCLEGPEAGVYYRGKGEIMNGTNVTINLPNYLSNIANEFTIEITGIHNGKNNIYNCSEIVNNSFDVYGENGEFYWTAYGKRFDIDAEPFKNEVVVKGDGPYLWI